MSKYGLMYQGSKNKIAEKIIDLLPPADNLYDLFAGGCAITHRALLSGKYKHIYANDICDMPKLFMDAINGKYANEDRWISREEFFKNLDDPYIKSTWSFGGIGSSYIYSKKIEPYKKALWYAIIFNDWTDFEVLMPETLSRCKTALDGVSDKKDRRLKLQRELTKYIKERELEGDHSWMMHPLYSQIKRGTYQGNLLTAAKHLESIQSLERLQSLHQGDLMYFVQNLELQSLERLEALRSLERLQSVDHLRSLQSLERLEAVQALQSLERLESLQSLESLERLESVQSLESVDRLESVQSLFPIKKGCINDVLTISKKSYEEVPILPNSVIYCDIPYYSTAGYNKSDFDYEKFYDWCMKQTVPVFISEYWMPEDRFECVYTTEVVRKAGSTKSSKITEKLFIPKNGSSISKS